MNSSLPMMFKQLEGQARAKAVTSAQWARAAGLRPETLSRLSKRVDCELQTLSNLAAAVGLEVALRPRLEREMPKSFGRKQEDVLLDLAASKSLDLGRWAVAGPRYFMAGFAAMLSTLEGFDRDGLSLVAEALFPGMTDVRELQAWLDRSPVKPSRFLPMLHQRKRSMQAAA